MLSSKPAAKPAPDERPNLAGWTLAFGAHLVWGTYPVMSKRLLGVVDPFTLLAIGYGLAALCVLPWWRGAWAAKPWLRGTWWALMLTVSARSITNILSVSFTLAIYVQLINLAAPFAVAILGRLFFGEAIPKRTFPALLICTLGSALMLAAGGVDAPPLTSRDLLGLTLAAASALCLALYMLLTRFAQRRSGESAMHVFVHQAVALAAVGATAAVLTDAPWAAWGGLGAGTWALFGVFVTLNLLGGNGLQIAALARIATPRFSSLIGLRLVAALALGALLLGEALTSLWQGLGALLVLAGVTWYVSAPNE